MIIGSRKINDRIVVGLVLNIKKKKELSNLSDDFVRSALKKYLAANAVMIKFLEGEFTEKSAQYKEIVKAVRAELRRVYGLFRVEGDVKERDNYFERLTKTSIGEDVFISLHKKILRTHASTKERLNFYEEFYQKLFSIIGNPKSIVDLGCGLNPFSIPLMKLDRTSYYAYDISADEIKLLNDYFDFMEKRGEIGKGKAEVLDARDVQKVKKLPKGDVCFLLKMTDVLDQGQGHKKSEEVITAIPAKFVVVSFPTFTVQGKHMNHPRRGWIEMMCKRLGYEFTLIKERNEIFYVIRK